MPIKGMKLDGEEFRELREKYFKQKAEEVKGFVATTKMVKEGLRMRLMDAKRTARLGQPAPNFEAYDVITQEKVHVLDFERRSCLPKQSRPLVLFFGSYT